MARVKYQARARQRRRHLNISLEPALIHRLKWLAESQGVSVSAILGEVARSAKESHHEAT